MITEIYECNSCGDEIRTTSTSGPEECSKCGNHLHFTYIGSEGESDD